jgi:hypothetical protein
MNQDFLLPRLVVALLVGAAILAACGGTPRSASDSLVAPCRTGSGVTGHATTASYAIELDIGPLATMYTPGQVASQHPTDGEVMLGGQMTSVGGMPGMAGMGGGSGTTDPSARHLEAHICSKATGAPVQNADPSITLVDATTPNISQFVPIATMEGLGEGVSDYHYGNNVDMAPGSSFTVTVSLNDQSATFHVHLPGTTPSGG